MNAVREPGTIDFSDGYSVYQTVWVVIRRKPDRFLFFLDRDEAAAEEGELWSRSMYEAQNGTIMNWSNFTRARWAK